MKNHFYLPFALLLVLNFFSKSTALLAQNSTGTATKKDIPNLYTGISSIVLQKDATELYLTNSLSSFWVAFNAFDDQIGAVRITNRVRYSRADHIFHVAHGFSKSGRWDLGADLYYTRVRVDDVAKSSPLRVYSNRETPEGKTYGGMSAIGIQTRFVPFAALPELSLRAGMVYPLARTDELQAQLNAQRVQLSLSGVYLNRLGPGTLALLQGEFKSYLRSPENDAALLIPSIGSYLIFELPNEQWYIFPGLAYNIVFQQFAKGYKYRQANQQLYGSLGVMFRPGERVSILVSGQIPFIFESGSARAIWVRESYSGFNAGLRFIL